MAYVEKIREANYRMRNCSLQALKEEVFSYYGRRNWGGGREIGKNLLLTDRWKDFIQLNGVLHLCWGWCYIFHSKIFCFSSRIFLRLVQIPIIILTRKMSWRAYVATKGQKIEDRCTFMTWCTKGPWPASKWKIIGNLMKTLPA